MGVFDELLVVPAAEPIIDCTGTPDKAAVAFVEGERDLTSLITFGGHPW